MLLAQLLLLSLQLGDLALQLEDAVDVHRLLHAHLGLHVAAIRLVGVAGGGRVGRVGFLVTAAARERLVVVLVLLLRVLLSALF